MGELAPVHKQEASHSVRSTILLPQAILGDQMMCTTAASAPRRSYQQRQKSID